MEQLSFMTEEQARAVRQTFGAPVFVYDRRTLKMRAQEALDFPNAFGLTVRYAMKALPTAAILRVFSAIGLQIDASSGYEAERAMLAGIAPGNIQLTAQELPENLHALLAKGVRFNACSLHQLDTYGKLAPNTDVSVRINPGLGSGHSNRTNVGGPSASFGIWHAYTDEILALSAKHGLRISGMHTHIGSGTDPEVWLHCAQLSLSIAERLPEVRRLSLGGGFKVGRMAAEHSANLQEIGQRIRPEFESFAQKTGRKLHLEIEPGTYLAANAGALVCSVIDIVDTGKSGFIFIKVNSGMTEIVRPSMYGAQHPIMVVPAEPESRGTGQYLVVGHCCESGDILTPEPGNPEGLLPRTLTEARIGDILVIEGAGAYCASMASKNYNSFPECAEILLNEDGTFTQIRRRQTLEQAVQNEIL